MFLADPFLLQVDLKSITLSEPNTLLLDYCSYSFAGEPFSAPEEVLRIDQIMRDRLGFFKKGAKFRQPHTIPESERVSAGSLQLRFTFESEVEVKGALLAIESPHKIKISLDGESISSSPVGWWVDKDIKTVSLPTITQGRHVLEVEYQYQALSNLERLYILGDFGVNIHGRTARIVPLELDKVEWGNIVNQGLPFYTGNVTYHTTISIDAGDEEDTVIQVANYSGAVVAVDLDGGRAGLLIHEPFAVNLGKISAGEHKVDFTCYGNRNNAFGQIHLVPDKTNWLGADSWRSDFDWFSEEPVLSKIGILNSPRVKKPGREKPQQTRRGKAAH